MFFGLFFGIFATQLTAANMQEFVPGKFKTNPPHPQVVSHAPDQQKAFIYANTVLHAPRATQQIKIAQALFCFATTERINGII
jgi:hypothetical protein